MPVDTWQPMTQRHRQTFLLRISLIAGSLAATGFVLKLPDGRLRGLLLVVLFVPGVMEALGAASLFGAIPRAIDVLAPSTWIARWLHKRQLAAGSKSGSLWHRQAVDDD